LARAAVTKKNLFVTLTPGYPDQYPENGSAVTLKFLSFLEKVSKVTNNLWLNLLNKVVRTIRFGTPR